MDRAEKAVELEHLKQRFAEDEVVIVAHNLGLTVAQSSQLRNEMRAAGGSLKVTKNKLAVLAVQGTRYEGLASLFVGPITVSSGKDPVAAAKVLYDFAKKNDKLKILGGGLGTTVMDTKAVEQLAKLPSLDQLRAQLLGLIQAPASKIARVVQAPASQLARVTKAYAEK